MKIEHKADYRQKRAAAYPPLADQIDALYKGGAEAEAMRQRILAIKTKYPKPKEQQT